MICKFCDVSKQFRDILFYVSLMLVWDLIPQFLCIFSIFYRLSYFQKVHYLWWQLIDCHQLDLTNYTFIATYITHTHTHTHIYIYIYICVCVCIYVCMDVCHICTFETLIHLPRMYALLNCISIVPILTHYTYCQSDPWKQTSVKIESKYKTFHSQKWIWKCSLGNDSHFIQDDE